jgi:hypothetical protein
MGLDWIENRRLASLETTMHIRYSETDSTTSLDLHARDSTIFVHSSLISDALSASFTHHYLVIEARWWRSRTGIEDPF